MIMNIHKEPNTIIINMIIRIDTKITIIMIIMIIKKVITKASPLQASLRNSHRILAQGKKSFIVHLTQNVAYAAKYNVDAVKKCSDAELHSTISY